MDTLKIIEELKKKRPELRKEPLIMDLELKFGRPKEGMESGLDMEEEAMGDDMLASDLDAASSEAMDESMLLDEEAGAAEEGAMDEEAAADDIFADLEAEGEGSAEDEEGGEEDIFASLDDLGSEGESLEDEEDFLMSKPRPKSKLRNKAAKYL